MDETDKVDSGCPECGHQNRPEQRFCGNCGASLEKTCVACGTSNAPDFRFCGNCGAPLEARRPTAEDSHVEERRWATVLFADLSGFTKASEKMDPEDVRTMADTCMKRLGEVVDRFGGQVEKIVGDELMAVFGAPVAHEDDAERAVRSAMDIQHAVEESPKDFGGFQVRIGINTGDVMFAPVGPESARRPTVMGDVVNTAARLESAAAPGSVLVGEQTYLTSRRSIRFNEVEPVRAKGKENPVRAWAPVEATQGPADRLVSAAPMVGREKELDLLESIWRRAVDEKRPHLVTILGPPGIGKSRLAREFISHLTAERAQIVKGRSLPYGESAGYGAFTQQIKQSAEIFEADEVEDAQRKLLELTRSLLSETEADEVASNLAVLAGIGTVATADKSALFFSARRFVESLARRTPTTVLFEDIHWADQSLLDLIESLATRSRESPLLFLCLARPELFEIRPNWGGGVAAYTTIPLEPLSLDHAMDLSRRLLTDSATQGALEKLTQTAEGNPLFLEELAATVADKTTESATTLPTTVRGIIAARLDGLPAEARSIVLDASVVGRVFWKGALRRMGRNGRLEEGLDILERRDFIRREHLSNIAGDEEFTFKHMLLREVAYATVPKAVRRDRHGSVARFIEEAAGERREESASLLAHHYREAGESEKAIEYLLQAADIAGRAWANGEAISLYEQALELVGDGDAAKRRTIRVRKATVLQESGNYQAAVDELGGLLPDLDGREKFQALLVLARGAFWLMDSSGARAHAEQAARLAETLGDQELQGPALGVALMVEGMEGRVRESVDIGKRALASWPSGTRPVDLSSVLTQVAIGEYWMGDHEESVRDGRRAYEIAKEVQNVEAVLTAGPNLAVALAASGKYEEAMPLFEELTTLGRESELVPRLTGRVVSMWAGACRDLFMLPRSRELNEEATELARVSGFANTAVQAATDLLFLGLVSGDLSGVDRDLPNVLEQARVLKGWHEWLVGGRLAVVQAMLALRKEEYEEATRLARDAIVRTSAPERPRYEVLARVVLGKALAGLGSPLDGAAEARRALAIAEGIDHRPSMWTAAHALSQTLHAAGDDDGVSSAAAQAKQTLQEFAASLPDPYRESFLEAEQTREILEAGG